MAAEPMRAPSPEAEQPAAAPPAQEKAPPMTLNEALTGVPTPEPPPTPESFREKEDRMAREGMAKLNEMGKSFNAQAEAGVQQFKEETASWWQRAKGFFKKGEVPATGEAEIMKEIEKSNTAYADFQKRYAEIMSSGDEAGMRKLEQDLSQTFEVLAPKVAEEGAAESKQWKKALKTGEAPQITQTGAMLNDVTRRLMEVRGRLNGAPPAEAPKPKPEAAPARSEQAAAWKPVLNDAEAAPEEEDDEEEESEAERPPAPPRTLEQDREELTRASLGKPGEKMVDEYLELRGLDEDAHGTIVGRSFDPLKGEIRLTYEDGSQYRKYSTGMVLHVLPGGLKEEVPSLPGPKKPQAEIVEDPEEEEVFNDAEKAQLAEGAAQLAAEQSMNARGEIEAKPAATEPVAEPSVIVAEESPEPAAPASEPVLATHIDHLGGDEEGEGKAEEAASPEPEPVQGEISNAVELPEPAPAPAIEAVPEPASAEVSEAQLAKAKENPLATESLPAIVKTLRDKGKAGDGKFATPASFIQALENAGFKMPSDMEADEPKKLHEAYKKALRGKK